MWVQQQRVRALAVPVGCKDDFGWGAQQADELLSGRRLSTAVDRRQHQQRGGTVSISGSLLQRRVQPRLLSSSAMAPKRSASGKGLLVAADDDDRFDLRYRSQAFQRVC
jgi:hypothetical protein